MTIVFSAKVFAETKLGVWTRREAIENIKNKLESGKLNIKIEGELEDNILIILKEKE